MLYTTTGTQGSTCRGYLQPCHADHAPHLEHATGTGISDLQQLGRNTQCPQKLLLQGGTQVTPAAQTLPLPCPPQRQRLCTQAGVLYATRSPQPTSCADTCITYIPAPTAQRGPGRARLKTGYPQGVVHGQQGALGGAPAAWRMVVHKHNTQATPMQSSWPDFCHSTPHAIWQLPPTKHSTAGLLQPHPDKHGHADGRLTRPDSPRWLHLVAQATPCQTPQLHQHS
jgi:hypothetical protein